MHPTVSAADTCPTGRRGISTPLIEVRTYYNLDILNISNKSTVINTILREVLDVTFGTKYVRNYVRICSDNS